MTVKVDDSPQAATRIDKWLWAARFFKTRSQATQAVERGKALVNDARVKPARDVRPGDVVAVDNGSTRWVVRVKAIAEVRGSAPIAQSLYEETEASVQARIDENDRRKLFQEPAAQLHGRPTKRDRRRMGGLDG